MKKQVSILVAVNFDDYFFEHFVGYGAKACSFWNMLSDKFVVVFDTAFFQDEYGLAKNTWLSTVWQ